MRYRVKVKVTGRKGVDDLMAWDRVWRLVNGRSSPFHGITMRWTGDRA
jgi:hypothetical protein